MPKQANINAYLRVARWAERRYARADGYLVIEAGGVADAEALAQSYGL